jgi:hypothetical protein
MGADEPGRVSLSRLLDFNHFRSQIAQNHGAIRPGQIAGETQNFHSFQWAWHFGVSFIFSFEKPGSGSFRDFFLFQR